VRGSAEVPTIAVPRRQVLVSEGEVAELRCDAHGVPEPRITWQRDGIQVGNSSQCTSVDEHIRPL